MYFYQGGTFMPISETQLIEGIKNEIEYSLAALVSRLRRRATENIPIDYIDDARVDFQNVLASAIVSAIRDAIAKGIE